MSNLDHSLRNTCVSTRRDSGDFPIQEPNVLLCELLIGLGDLCDEIALQSDPGAASLRPYKSNSTPVTSF
jgi:hypothetical protein